jgi:hypothetical protein
MARNNRKGKGAGPIPHSSRTKKQLLQIKTNNRKKNLSQTQKI